MSEHITLKIELGNIDETNSLFGPNDQFLKEIEKHFPVKIVTRGGVISIIGEPDVAKKVQSVILDLQELIASKHEVQIRDVIYTIQMQNQNQDDPQKTNIAQILNEEIAKTLKGRAIKVKTVGQKEYIQQIKSKDIVFGVGPAGSGKTFLAVVMAVNALKNNEVKKIILTRPAVEAGEQLGFLPGDLQEKVDPYLRPLYDALTEMLGLETMQKFIERGTIEIAPLAFMRGRTLNDSFVILDEAQNSTIEQMKMFLTRLGFGSKMVVTGDVTQIDLPKGKTSGLNHAVKTLQHIPDIGFTFLKEVDIVRHQLVQKIVKAYEAPPET
ncbi:phosphate starvation-inducible protein PhoH [Desulfuribacillus stibiiarsenatis]|uniref:PhoH-like protein n=1 Tax=Desulfuribacillus stibiiarsenatis TaxID=1390249 RepID=A0A1E5L7X4_9FIRM|nr:PhoH family protein [Desulfuribacillus stibiiarsenatis]OEH86158.1 phosphate starvation-inducible protein PhoH [Desulfuribacillus stibiiarsenatis]